MRRVRRRYFDEVLDAKPSMLGRRLSLLPCSRVSTAVAPELATASHVGLGRSEPLLAQNTSEIDDGGGLPVKDVDTCRPCLATKAIDQNGGECF